MTSSVWTHLNGGSSSELSDMGRTCFGCPPECSPVRLWDHVRLRTCVFRF
ncbi:hypothetical protein HanLR1_Chr14g0536161 [Helianthus annuus]|nr:hypothetical protein HanHA89_Chr14g0573761 [Helianthus annuus]KAJ0656470.1 hypothetical protein HanLR1_Chr14g0536161 [Helianthus annuus]